MKPYHPNPDGRDGRLETSMAKKKQKQRVEAEERDDERFDEASEAQASHMQNTEHVRAYRINARGALQPVNFRWTPRTKDDTARRKLKFLKLLAETGSVSVATIGIKSYRGNVYKWKREDPDFAAAWNDIWEATIDELETSLMRRAIHGYERPIYQQGKLVGAETVHHPALGMFFLSKARGEKYGDTIIPAITPTEYAKMIREATRQQDEEAERALKENQT